MRASLSRLLLSLVLVTCNGFSCFVVTLGPPRNPSYLCSEPSDNDELVLGEQLQSELQNLQSKYPTSEAAYLKAARERAAQKTASTTNTASDAEWQAMANEQREQFGQPTDDWEASQAEAGNTDSQILIPMNDEGEDEEPKLLL